MSYSDFLDSYVTCLIWQSSDDEISDTSDAANLLDFAPEARVEIQQDCEAFYDANRELWADGNGWTDEQAGHDFALTRNGHGAGFWDRYSVGELEAAGRKLTEAAKVYGESNPYQGDDGRLYVS